MAVQSWPMAFKKRHSHEYTLDVPVGQYILHVLWCRSGVEQAFFHDALLFTSHFSRYVLSLVTKTQGSAARHIHIHMPSTHPGTKLTPGRKACNSVSHFTVNAQTRVFTMSKTMNMTCPRAK